MMSQNGTFNGFAEPTENWSRLPHELIEAMPNITSLAELKVILYVLRHTWGYQEYTEGKKITLDEFENGRKRRDGTRIDAGVGMSRPSIVNGIKRAVNHGFILVVVDTSDAARTKKYYCLNSPQSEGLKSLTPGVKEFNTRGKEVLPRSEKETKRKIPKKSKRVATPPPPAVEVYNGVFKMNAPKDLYGDIEATITDLEQWRRVCEAWRLQNHYQFNFRGLFDWYQKGIPRHARKHRNESSVDLGAASEAALARIKQSAEGTHGHPAIPAHF